VSSLAVKTCAILFGRRVEFVRFSGRKRHVKSVEHDAGLQIGGEGPSDDPARPRVMQAAITNELARMFVDCD
jgi:hypothetical protein